MPDFVCRQPVIEVEPRSIVAALFSPDVDRLAVGRLSEKLTENIRAESIRACRIRAEVMAARSQHQIGTARGAHGRQRRTIDINHQGDSVLPGASPEVRRCLPESVCR